MKIRIIFLLAMFAWPCFANDPLCLYWPLTLEYAIASGAVQVNQVDFLGDSALHRVTRCRRHDLVEILLRHGGDFRLLNHAGFAPPHIAAANGDVQMLQIFINHNILSVLLPTGPKTGGDYVSEMASALPLHLAALYGHPPATELLLDWTPRNAQNAKGSTAAHVAVLAQNPEILLMTLGRNIDLSRSNNRRQTVLALAASRHDEESSREIVIELFRRRHGHAAEALRRLMDRPSPILQNMNLHDDSVSPMASFLKTVQTQLTGSNKFSCQQEVDALRLWIKSLIELN